MLRWFVGSWNAFIPRLISWFEPAIGSNQDTRTIYFQLFSEHSFPSESNGPAWHQIRVPRPWPWLRPPMASAWMEKNRRRRDYLRSLQCQKNPRCFSAPVGTFFLVYFETFFNKAVSFSLSGIWSYFWSSAHHHRHQQQKIIQKFQMCPWLKKTQTGAAFLPISKTLSLVLQSNARNSRKAQLFC